MRPSYDLVLRGPRVITCEGGECEGPAAVAVSDGRIAAIGRVDESWAADEHVNLGPDEVLLPGLVDSHVHVCEPGNTDWEGFATATSAAAAGGITTIVDMPLDSSPTTVSVGALDLKRAAAAGQCAVDVAFWGGVVPDNLGTLGDLHRAGVVGFKCFLVDSGSPEFPPVTTGQLADALRELKPFGSPLLVHAESADAVAASGDPAPGRGYAAFLASRPRGIENLAIAQVIEAARATGGWAHIVHLSSSDALPMIESARREGVRVTAETCPHYLALAAEEIPDGATAAKCLPPVREAENRDKLWAGLAAGILDCVVSDHSPSTPEMKGVASGDFAAAWGGISSLQLGLPVAWTGASERGAPLATVARWMARKPADLAGLADKGRIAVGAAADFCVFAPDEYATVTAASLRHRHPLTPYEGARVRGVVRSAWLAGRVVAVSSARGRLLASRQSEIPGGAPQCG